MARPALADLNELETRLGHTISDPSAEAQAEARLADASEIVRAYAGEDWLNDDGDAVENVPGQIPGIVATMVERASLNPGGVVQETAGPFARSFGVDAAARLYLTKGEKAIIRRAVGVLNVGALATTRGDLETPAVIDCWTPFDPLADEG